MQVSIQTSDMGDLLEKLKGFPIDVLITDIFLRGLNGSEVLSVVRDKFPNIKILVLSMCTEIELLSEILDVGIHGCVSKYDEPEELLQAIESVAGGRIYRNKLFTEALYWNKQNNIRSNAADFSVTLSDRERKVLQLIWEEKSNKEIADTIFLGIRSVEKLRQDLKDKLGVKSTVGMLKYAINKRIIRANTHNFSI